MAPGHCLTVLLILCANQSNAVRTDSTQHPAEVAPTQRVYRIIFVNDKDIALLYPQRPSLLLMHIKPLRFGLRCRGVWL